MTYGRPWLSRETGLPLQVTRHPRDLIAAIYYTSCQTDGQIPALHVCRPSRSLALAKHFSLPDYTNFLREARGRSHFIKNIFRETVEYYCADFLPKGGGSSFSFVLYAITSVIQLYRDKKLVDSGYKEKEHEKPLRTLVRLVSDICKVYGAEREEGRVEPESGSGQRNFDGLTLWRERLLCSPP